MKPGVNCPLSPAEKRKQYAWKLETNLEQKYRFFINNYLKTQHTNYWQVYDCRLIIIVMVIG